MAGRRFGGVCWLEALKFELPNGQWIWVQASTDPYPKLTWYLMKRSPTDTSIINVDDDEPAHVCEMGFDEYDDTPSRGRLFDHMYFELVGRTQYVYDGNRFPFIVASWLPSLKAALLDIGNARFALRARG